MTTTQVAADRSPWHGNADADERRTWLAIADEVGTALAADALLRDRENSRPFDAVNLLRTSGLANFLIPKELGGHGGHWETAFEITRRLARADASIAQILGYHWLNQACVVFYGPDPSKQAQWLSRSAENTWIWSDAFNPVSPDLELAWTGEHYLLSGLKRFATGASVADIVISAGVPTEGPFAGELIVFAVSSSADGVEHLNDWDHLGQRSSASGGTRFTNVVIEESAIIGADLGEPVGAPRRVVLRRDL